MATFDYYKSRATADGLIKKFGNRAILRRSSGDRDCWAVETVLSAREKNDLKNWNMRIFLISAVDLETPPNKEDSLVLINPDGDELPPLRQVAPVAPLAPAGIVVYYQLQVE